MLKDKEKFSLTIAETDMHKLVTVNSPVKFYNCILIVFF